MPEKIGSIGSSFNEQKIYDSSPATGGQVPHQYSFDQIPDIKKYQSFSTFDDVGYDPRRDNESIYYKYTGSGEQLYNSMGQFAYKTAASFMDQLNYFQQAKATGGSIDQNYLEEILQRDEELNAKFPLLKSNNETAGLAGYLPGSSGSLSKWSNFIPNLGFTAGAILATAAETAVISAATGGLGVPTGLVGSANAIRQIMRVKTLVNSVKATKAINSAAQLGRLANITKKAYKTLAINGTLGLAQNYSSASAEALTESAHAYGDTYEKLLDQFQQANGTASEEEKELLKSQAMDAASITYRGNVAVLMTSNYLQSFNALTIGRKLGQIGKATSAQSRVARNFKFTAKDLVSKKVALDRIKEFGKKSGKFLTTALSEGFEESSQGLISKAAEEYVSANYGGKSITWAGAMGEGLNYAISDEGMEEFWAGILTSVLMGGGNSIIDNFQKVNLDDIKNFKSNLKENQLQSKEDVAAMNAKIKELHRLDIEIGPAATNARVQGHHYAANKEEAENGTLSEFDFQNRKQNTFFSFVNDFMKRGAIDDYVKSLEESRSLTKEEYVKIYGEEALGNKTVAEKVDGMLSEIKQAADTIKIFNESSPNIFKKGTDNYYQLEMLNDLGAYALYSMQASAKRNTKLKAEVRSLSEEQFNLDGERIGIDNYTFLKALLDDGNQKTVLAQMQQFIDSNEKSISSLKESSDKNNQKLIAEYSEKNKKLNKAKEVLTKGDLENAISFLGLSSTELLADTTRFESALKDTFHLEKQVAFFNDLFKNAKGDILNIAEDYSASKFAENPTEKEIEEFEQKLTDEQKDNLIRLKNQLKSPQMSLYDVFQYSQERKRGTTETLYINKTKELYMYDGPLYFDPDNNKEKTKEETKAKPEEKVTTSKDDTPLTEVEVVEEEAPSTTPTVAPTQNDQASDVAEIERRRQEKLKTTGKKQIEKALKGIKQSFSEDLEATEEEINAAINPHSKVSKEETREIARKNIILNKIKKSGILNVLKSLSALKQSLKQNPNLATKEILKEIENLEIKLKELNIEVTDLQGKEYKDGQNVTASFIPSQNNNSITNKQVITETVKPQVNYKGILVQSAVIVVTDNYDVNVDGETSADRINAKYDAEIIDEVKKGNISLQEAKEVIGERWKKEYDAELKALEQQSLKETTKAETTPTSSQSEIEAKKAEIEKDRNKAKNAIIYDDKITGKYSVGFGVSNSILDDLSVLSYEEQETETKEELIKTIDKIYDKKQAELKALEQQSTSTQSEIEVKSVLIQKEIQEARNRIVDIENNLLPKVNNRLSNNLQPELSGLYEKLRNTKDEVLKKDINDQIDKLNKQRLTKNDIIDLERQKESLEGQIESAKKFIEKKNAELKALEVKKEDLFVDDEQVNEYEELINLVAGIQKNIDDVDSDAIYMSIVYNNGKTFNTKDYSYVGQENGVLTFKHKNSKIPDRKVKLSSIKEVVEIHAAPPIVEEKIEDNIIEDSNLDQEKRIATRASATADVIPGGFPHPNIVKGTTTYDAVLDASSQKMAEINVKLKKSGKSFSENGMTLIVTAVTKDMIAKFQAIQNKLEIPSTQLKYILDNHSDTKPSVLFSIKNGDKTETITIEGIEIPLLVNVASNTQASKLKDIVRKTGVDLEITTNIDITPGQPISEDRTNKVDEFFIETSGENFQISTSEKNPVKINTLNPNNLEIKLEGNIEHVPLNSLKFSDEKTSELTQTLSNLLRIFVSEDNVSEKLKNNVISFLRNTLNSSPGLKGKIIKPNNSKKEAFKDAIVIEEKTVLADGTSASLKFVFKPNDANQSMYVLILNDKGEKMNEMTTVEDVMTVFDNWVKTYKHVQINATQLNNPNYKIAVPSIVDGKVTFDKVNYREFIAPFIYTYRNSQTIGNGIHFKFDKDTVQEEQDSMVKFVDKLVEDHQNIDEQEVSKKKEEKVSEEINNALVEITEDDKEEIKKEVESISNEQDTLSFFEKIDEKTCIVKK